MRRFGRNTMNLWRFVIDFEVYHCWWIKSVDLANAIGIFLGTCCAMKIFYQKSSYDSDSVLAVTVLSSCYSKVPSVWVSMFLLLIFKVIITIPLFFFNLCHPNFFVMFGCRIANMFLSKKQGKRNWWLIGLSQHHQVRPHNSKIFSCRKMLFFVTRFKTCVNV